MKFWKFWSPRDSGAVGGIIFGCLLSGALKLLGLAPVAIAVLVTVAAVIVYLIDRMNASNDG